MARANRRVPKSWTSWVDSILAVLVWVSGIFFSSYFAVLTSRCTAERFPLTLSCRPNLVCRKNMKNILSPLRYVSFALFIASNAILCSVAIWDLSLAQLVRKNPQIDTYLAVISALSLAFALGIMFVEISGKPSVVGQVWFECSWVGLLSALHFAGAAASSAILPSLMCAVKLGSLIKDGCTSTHVLLAFAWISTVILWCYLIFLITISTLLYQRTERKIWHCPVSKFPGSDLCQALSSPPSSPNLPRFRKKPVSIKAPQPHRAPPPALYAYRDGLGSDYQIEHYQPPPDLPVPPIPAALPVESLVIRPSASLYGQHIQSAILSEPTSARPLPLKPIFTPPSPPPLGNWPRTDAPVRKVRRKQPSIPQATPSLRQQTFPTTTDASSLDPSPPRPRGPRKRSTSGEAIRPPPLDLSNISAYRP